MTENQNNQPVQNNPTDKQKQSNPANQVSQDKKKDVSKEAPEHEEEESPIYKKEQGDLKASGKQEVPVSQNTNKTGI